MHLSLYRETPGPVPLHAPADLDGWLRGFSLDHELHSHTMVVLSALPEEVRTDLLADGRTTFCDYDPLPGAVLRVAVNSPGRKGGTYSVALKRTLRRRPADFVRWVIAHELAHAHLRHGGRWPGEDPERAADAVAAAWGFPRPA